MYIYLMNIEYYYDKRATRWKNLLTFIQYKYNNDLGMNNFYFLKYVNLNTIIFYKIIIVVYWLLFDVNLKPLDLSNDYLVYAKSIAS